jgi:hypothetical protein
MEGVAAAGLEGLDDDAAVGPGGGDGALFEGARVPATCADLPWNGNPSDPQNLRAPSTPNEVSFLEHKMTRKKQAFRNNVVTRL